MRKNVLEYLESSARMHADKPAFCDENRVFTFGELLKAAQGLGTHLAKTVDTLHKPVAVLIGRTAESVAAMQGVLYAGGCYVPIDDHMPEARIRRIFEQVHPVAIVYAEGNRKQAEPLADCAPLISMDEGFAAPADANLLQSTVRAYWILTRFTCCSPRVRPVRRRESSFRTVRSSTSPTG